MPKLNFFNYMGGKFYMVKDILSIMPEHTTYIEVFGGAGNLLLNKPPSKVEILNDYDETIYTVWRTMKEKGDEVIEYLKGLIYHEKLFKELVYKWKMGYRGNNEVELTGIFLYITTNSFAGHQGNNTISIAFERNRANTFQNKINNIYPQIVERIKNVQIMNRDFRDLLKFVKKNSKYDVLLYLDPPYISKEKYYKVSFTLDDHKDLAELLNDIEVKFILSYYEHEYLEEFYPKSKFNHIVLDKKKYSSSLNNHGQKRVNEVLITNFLGAEDGKRKTD